MTASADAVASVAGGAIPSEQGIGVLQIVDVSPTRANTSVLSGQSTSGKGLAVAISADGTRAYLGGHSGVWRSDDGGDTWSHPEWPQPPPGSYLVPGALSVPNVYDVLISPVLRQNRVRFARWTSVLV